MTGDAIRRAFLDFFAARDHLVLESAKLLPDDPTTYFTSAGMQPFVPYFLGNERPPRRRLATCQKCLRADDLDEVGYTARHLTFFEMLGNFSFGDYFKKEAIEWGWQFVREGLGLEPDVLWVSVYEDDDEAAELWADFMPRERIVRFGMADNWWGPVGNSGPCGPCSEIFLDRGPEWGSAASPVEDEGGDRYVELWNLVFQQYNAGVSKKELMAGRRDYRPLPAPGIDTGAGLERIAAAMQGVSTVFETDLLRPLTEAVIKLANDAGGRFVYGDDPEVTAAVNRISDHVRALTFALCDGIFPSNKAGGYVLRQILRRAARFGRLRLGLQEPFLWRLTQAVVDRYGHIYPEVGEGRAAAEAIIRQEEERFAEALDHGIPRLEEQLAALKQQQKSQLDGAAAFFLYETYGVPIEVQAEIAAEQGLTVNIVEFEALRRNREKAAIAKDISGHGDFQDDLLADLEPTEFTGYTEDVDAVRVVAIVTGGRLDATRGLLCEGARQESAEAGREVIVVCDKSPFYAESGGQVGDVGELVSEGLTLTIGSHAADRGAAPVVVAIEDTKKDKNGRWLHFGRVTEGTLQVGESLEARVDAERRDAIRRAHTATHLLHAALRGQLGPHVAQAGSLVEPDRLRFDFNHFAALSPAETQAIERQVNEFILLNEPLRIEEHPLEEARRLGALMFFGEKYGQTVRVVNVGEEFGGTSTELCGGTHVRRTGDIGHCRLIAEGSVGSGVRRVEALTGLAAVDHARTLEARLREVAAQLKSSPAEAPERLEALLAQMRELEREVERAHQARAAGLADQLAAAAEAVGDSKLICAALGEVEVEQVKQLVDELTDKLPDAVALLGAAAGGKVVLVCKAGPTAVARGAHCGEAVKAAAQVAGGGGGGRPNFAQAGGKDPARLAEAVAAGRAKLLAQLG